jgi:hypothetical protein
VNVYARCLEESGTSGSTRRSSGGETVAADAEALLVPRAGDGSRPLSDVERAALERWG